MKKLTSYPVRQLFEEQLQLFTAANIHTEDVMVFDPVQAAENLRQQEGVEVIGADYGGDKGVSRLFQVGSEGNLMATDKHDTYIQGTGGEGYLESFENIASYAGEKLPVGISWGSPLKEHTKPIYHPKFDIFLKQLEARYQGDLANVLPSLKACINDGPAGVVSGAVEAYRRFGSKTVLFPINGGGLGMAALVGGKIYATESGHIRAIGELNVYDQNTPCGVFGATHTCLETVGANKAGIETQWQQRHGEYMRAIDIETQYKAGDDFAGELYEHSAFVVAHMIAGTARALGVNLSDEEVVIVGHGGGFKFPEYGERVKQILENHYHNHINLLLTHEYVGPGSNACLEGAAIAALSA